MDKVFVAVNTRTLRHFLVSWFNLNRFVVVVQCESDGMEETVVRLCDPFANKVMGKMAIITDSDVVMRAILPTVIMLLHDVAIRARLRIIAQVAGPLPVSKSKCADTSKHPQQYCQSNQSIPQGEEFLPGHRKC